MYPPITPKGGDNNIIDIITDFYLAVLKVSTNKGTYIVIKTWKKPLANLEKHWTENMLLYENTISPIPFPNKEANIKTLYEIIFNINVAQRDPK
jgi:hypothetical protein